MTTACPTCDSESIDIFDTDEGDADSRILNCCCMSCGCVFDVTQRLTVTDITVVS